MRLDPGCVLCTHATPFAGGCRASNLSRDPLGPSRDWGRGVPRRARADDHRPGNRRGAAGVARIARVDRNRRWTNHRGRDGRGRLKHRPAEQPVAQPASAGTNQKDTRKAKNRHLSHIRFLRHVRPRGSERGDLGTRQLYLTLAEVQMQREAVLLHCGCLAETWPRLFLAAKASQAAPPRLLRSFGPTLYGFPRSQPAGRFATLGESLWSNLWSGYGPSGYMQPLRSAGGGVAAGRA